MSKLYPVTPEFAARARVNHADYQRLYTEFGMTAQAVADAAHSSIAAAG